MWEFSVEIDLEMWSKWSINSAFLFNHLPPRGCFCLHLPTVRSNTPVRATSGFFNTEHESKYCAVAGARELRRRWRIFFSPRRMEYDLLNEIKVFLLSFHPLYNRQAILSFTHISLAFLKNIKERLCVLNVNVTFLYQVSKPQRDNRNQLVSQTFHYIKSNYKRIKKSTTCLSS